MKRGQYIYGTMEQNQQTNSRTQNDAPNTTPSADEVPDDAPPPPTTKRSWQERGDTNYFILASSGKPIFARYGTDEQVGRMCGIIQGLCSSILYDTTDLQMGQLQSIESNNLQLVLWNVADMMFVAVSLAHPSRTRRTSQVYLKFVLETLYCQLTFSLTKPVLDSLSQNPYYDIASVMGTTERQLCALLDQLDGGAACDDDDDSMNHVDKSSPLSLVHALGGAIQPLFPLSSTARDEASRALRDLGDSTPDTLFAMIACRPGRLISLVQSASLPLKSADATLWMWCLQQQSELGKTTDCELWLPLCLPRFNASGYVYCYARCLHVDTGLYLALVSHIGTTDQFGLFQKAASRLCAQLGIPRQGVASTTSTTATTTAIEKQITKDKDGDEGSDQDYVDASGDGDRMIPYVRAHGLVEEIALACDGDDAIATTKIRNQYLQICQAVHFVFRYDVALPRTRMRRRRHPPTQRKKNRLPQCICVCHENHFQSASTRCALWTIYDDLMMRLRLGSAQNESVHDALTMIASDQSTSGPPPVHAAVDSACHTLTLLDAAPDFAGMTSVLQGDYLHVGINGDSFELYFTVPHTKSVKEATASGAKLVRRLFQDQEKLFLSNPLVWRQ